MQHVTVIQHTQSEWLGGIEDHLEGRGIGFGYSRPFAAAGTLPDASVIGDGLILVGGGAWGAAGPPLLPTLDAEIRLVRACLMLDRPVLGFGLGAHVLALAAEGDVTAAPLALGVIECRRTSDTALGGLLPEAFPAILYGRDRPEPPDYAETLARDAAGRAMVFQIGRRAFGFLGHPGMRPAMVEDLVMECPETPPEVTRGIAAARAAGRAVEDALVPIMAGLVAACGWV